MDWMVSSLLTSLGYGDGVAAFLANALLYHETAAFEQAIRADEREKCAQVADKYAANPIGPPAPLAGAKALLAAYRKEFPDD